METHLICPSKKWIDVIYKLVNGNTVQKEWHAQYSKKLIEYLSIQYKWVAVLWKRKLVAGCFLAPLNQGNQCLLWSVHKQVPDAENVLRLFLEKHNPVLSCPGSMYSDIMIPINIPRLKQLGLIDDYNSIQTQDNPLFLVSYGWNEILDKLKSFYSEHKTYPLLSEIHIKPHPDVTLCFCAEQDATITEFVMVYLSQSINPESGQILLIAHLGPLYYTHLTLSMVILFLVERLKEYEVDQLVFRDTSFHSGIKITKYIDPPSHDYPGTEPCISVLPF